MIVTNKSRKELIELAKNFLDSLNKLSEEEIDRLYQELNSHFSHPDVANLFFYPENYNARTCNLPGYNPTIEEVIDAGINHKHIQP